MAGKQSGKRRGGAHALPLLAILLFLVGAGVFLYPSVSNYFAKRQQTSVIREYQAAVESRDARDLTEEWEKAEVYNENLAGDPVKDPFLAGSGYALPQNYQEVLTVDGVMAYVEIPKIDVLLPVYHGTSDEVLEEGVGHIESTALPIGGESRHTVLTGHRGLPGALLFTRLDELETGDVFYIHVLDETLAYEVDQIKTVLPAELSDIQPVPGRDLATLLTCTPYGVNTHRLLVRGTRTEYVPRETQESGRSGQSRGLHFEWSEAGIIAGLGVTAGMLALNRTRRRKRRGR